MYGKCLALAASGADSTSGLSGTEKKQLYDLQHVIKQLQE